MKNRDETYIINHCDKVLNLVAKRQHTFDFLRGDPSRSGARGRKLPIDAFYPEINLAIEYRERQHSEQVPFFDKPGRLTCSGCGRGEQRAKYDQRRRDVLPRYRIKLVELDCSMFPCNAQRRLRRDVATDEAVIRKKLSRFLRKLRQVAQKNTTVTKSSTAV
jgi:hypothetical protein